MGGILLYIRCGLSLCPTFRQVLCPDLDSEEEGVWMVDELETCAFAKVGEMKVVRYLAARREPS